MLVKCSIKDLIVVHFAVTDAVGLAQHRDTCLHVLHLYIYTAYVSTGIRSFMFFTYTYIHMFFTYTYIQHTSAPGYVPSCSSPTHMYSIRQHQDTCLDVLHLYIHTAYVSTGIRSFMFFTYTYIQHTSASGYVPSSSSPIHIYSIRQQVFLFS